ncbi:MAG TPA: porin family protein [Gemmatimonadaceae bacterium]|nr:porin family protein [Gemmatimonadaceae bacterium]
MIKKFAVIALVTVCGAVCAAPSNAGAQGFGLKGGLSYGNVSNSGALPGSVKQRTGYAVGISLSSSGIIGFGIEGLYAQRGVTSETTGFSRDLNYIDVPVYLRLALPLGPIKPFAYAGPQGSYELKCGTDSGDCDGSGRPKVTYAGVIGAGVRILGISLEGRYVYGLTDLKLGTVTTTDSYKTRSFLILAGIGF